MTRPELCNNASTTRGSASSNWTGAGGSWRGTTAPGASCGTAMGCWTGTGCCAPADQVRLERLVGGALPASGAVAVSGSMVLRRSSVVPPFVVHVKPVGGPQADHGARHVAALVLIVEPGRPHRINPGLVATTLELTPAETQVAVGLAEGMSVRDMADATGHTKAAIYWHLQQIYQKHSISRQADLVRLVLSLAELG